MMNRLFVYSRCNFWIRDNVFRRLYFGSFYRLGFSCGFTYIISTTFSRRNRGCCRFHSGASGDEYVHGFHQTSIAQMKRQFNWFSIGPQNCFGFCSRVIVVVVVVVVVVVGVIGVIGRAGGRGNHVEGGLPLISPSLVAIVGQREGTSLV